MQRLLSLCVTLALAATGVAAQQPGGALRQGIVQSPIIVVDVERLFAESAFGRQLNAQIEAERASIAAENRRIEAELIEEEQRLTEARASMDAVEFRLLADAFDEKVQRLREEQDSKARELGARNEDARGQFRSFVRPVLQSLMIAAGAGVILEKRSVFVVSDTVDVTDLAIAHINAAMANEGEP